MARIVSGMRERAAAPGCALAGATALHTLLSAWEGSAACAAAAADCGAVRALLTCVRAHGRDANVLQASCRALVHLTANSEEARWQAADEGAAETVSSAARLMTADPSVQRTTQWAADNLRKCQDSPRARSARSSTGSMPSNVASASTRHLEALAQSHSGEQGGGGGAGARPPPRKAASALGPSSLGGRRRQEDSGAESGSRSAPAPEAPRQSSSLSSLLSGGAGGAGERGRDRERGYGSGGSGYGSGRDSRSASPSSSDRGGNGAPHPVAVPAAPRHGRSRLSVSSTSVSAPSAHLGLVAEETQQRARDAAAASANTAASVSGEETQPHAQPQQRTQAVQHMYFGGGAGGGYGSSDEEACNTPRAPRLSSGSSQGNGEQVGGASAPQGARPPFSGGLPPTYKGPRACDAAAAGGGGGGGKARVPLQQLAGRNASSGGATGKPAGGVAVTAGGAGR